MWKYTCKTKYPTSFQVFLLFFFLFWIFIPFFSFAMKAYKTLRHWSLHDIIHAVRSHMNFKYIFDKKKRIASHSNQPFGSFVLIVIRFLYCLSLVKICHRLEMQRTVILVFLLQNRIEKESITKLFAFTFAFDMNLNQRLLVVCSDWMWFRFR